MVGVQDSDRIAMSQVERDRLVVLRSVSSGDRSQAEAARLLKLSVRQVRRLQRKLKANGCTAPLGLGAKSGLESGGFVDQHHPWKTEDGPPAPSFGFPSWG